MADYPAGLPIYNDHKFIDAVTEVNAANNNYWWQELVAVCTELGINPKGSASDLVTRLAISLELSGKLKLYQTCTSATRPASPPEGMLIYETDTKKFYKCTTGGAGAVWAEIATLSEVLLLAGGTMAGAINMGGFGITNLLNPVSAQDAATRGWVETLVAGINWQEKVLDRDLSTPPSPIAGRYIVKTAGLGAWAGHDNDIADGSSGAWVFTAEGEGMACYVDDENIFVYFDGTDWVKLASGIGTITQAMVQPDAAEATTWDAGITSLLNNLNRIRNQIITITGEAWGTVSHSIAAVWAKFHATTGHKHTGAAEDAPVLDAAYTHGSPGADTHHAKQHAITATADHTSAATSGKILKADANGLPVNASNTDTEVASAVSLKHTQGTDQGLDTGGANAVVVADVKDAVTKKHAGSHAGTSGKIAKFTGTNALGDSALTETQMRTRHLRFVVVDPNTLVTLVLCLVPKTESAITVTNLEVTCDADPATEITGDIKYADAFIGLANPVVINDFDTAAGVRSDNTITSAAVAANKCIYVSFDIAPIAAILLISFDISYLID